MIERDPKGAAAREYDLVVVGGGVYGAALALEAARRGLEVILLERDDFGGATTANSLAVLHGGLRYLQSADLHRFRESVGERSWFLRSFPDLAAPLPCLMPLYGEGLKRPFFFGAALAMNGLLSSGRNRGIPDDRRLPNGEVIGREEAARRFPGVRRDGLRGAGVWYDASMENPRRLLMEMLRWASAAGARMLNYCPATGLVAEEGRVAAVEARDRTSGETLFLRAERVVNAAGPWCREVAAAFDRDVPALFRPSVAFNVLLDRKPLSDHALAVAPPERGSRVYFLTPRRDRIFAGTLHAPADDGAEPGRFSEEDLGRFVDDLNRAVPGFGIDRSDILRVYAGVLPVREKGTVNLAVREVIHDHGAAGGPKGLLSVSGVKYTTARLVAEKTLRAAFGKADLPSYREGTERSEPTEPAAALDLDDPEKFLAAPDADVLPHLRRLVEEESVVSIEDIVERRTDWGALPAEGEEAAEKLARLLPEIGATGGGGETL